jgi:hypothetical protein
MPDSKRCLVTIMPAHRNVSEGGRFQRSISDEGISDIVLYTSLMRERSSYKAIQQINRVSKHLDSVKPQKDPQKIRSFKFYVNITRPYGSQVILSHFLKIIHKPKSSYQ